MSRKGFWATCLLLSSIANGATGTTIKKYSQFTYTYYAADLHIDLCDGAGSQEPCGWPEFDNLNPVVNPDDGGFRRLTSFYFFTEGLRPNALAGRTQTICFGEQFCRSEANDNAMWDAVYQEYPPDKYDAWKVTMKFNARQEITSWSGFLTGFDSGDGYFINSEERTLDSINVPGDIGNLTGLKYFDTRDPFITRRYFSTRRGYWEGEKSFSCFDESQENEEMTGFKRIDCSTLTPVPISASWLFLAFGVAMLRIHRLFPGLGGNASS